MHVRDRRARRHEGQVTPLRPGRPAPARAALAAVGLAAAALAALGCPRHPKAVVYDLAARLPYAERWSEREVVLFGTPAAEPQLAEGFFREAAPAAEGDAFVWARGEAEVSLTWPEVFEREAVLDLAPYVGVKAQRAEVLLNGTHVAEIRMNEGRQRYAITLPAAGQKGGENRLRFVFADTASPADDPENPDKRQLAAAFYAMAVGKAGDPALEDLLARDAPRPFSAAPSASGAPTLVQIGPSVVRYAVRLPAGAELRFTPDLHPSARAAAASAVFRVTVETTAGEEREVWSAVLGPRSPRPQEVRVALPGTEGALARIGLHVGGPPGARFLWGLWTAPRILGRDADAEVVGARPSPSPEERRRGDGLRDALKGANVLLIVMDAARADHFGCYGYSRSTSPNVDAIAREGVVFERAYTPAAYTLAAMSSVWTSQYPDRHQEDASFAAGLPKDRLTLSELLSAQAIPTVGFVANVVAGSLNGFDRGFSEFHDVWKETGSSADRLGDAVPPWLAAHKGSRFFAYVHFKEPHQPYQPPPPFDTRFGPAGALPAALRHEPLAQDDWIKAVNNGRRPIAPAELAEIVRLYDGNVAFADAMIGKIRAEMEKDGLWDRTVVIVTGDHGESLREHGFIGHNTQVYEESVHVPLVVRFPKGKGPSGVRVRAMVDHLDLAPTVADLMGVMGKGGSHRQFQGRSLLPVLFGGAGEAAVLSRTIWDRPVYSLRDGGHAFVYDTRTGAEQLFDLAADPGETRNLAIADPLRASWSRQTLFHWVADVTRRGPAGEGETPPVFTREQCENLKSMNYLGSEVKCPER